MNHAYRPDPRHLHRAARILGKKWCAAIIYSLRNGPLGFNVLRTLHDPVSPRIQSKCLDFLADEGVVERRIVATDPVRTSYELTPAGVALVLVIEAAQAWSREHDSPSSPSSSPIAA